MKHFNITKIITYNQITSQNERKISMKTKIQYNTIQYNTTQHINITQIQLYDCIFNRIYTIINNVGIDDKYIGYHIIEVTTELGDTRIVPTQLLAR